MNYYTYAYLREDGTPYYIGKGKGYRVYDKHNRTSPPPKNRNRIIFLKQNLTEEEAFKHEIYMIAVFGRKDLGTGILRNLTSGGDGCSGLIQTEEHRKKISKANRGRVMSMKNRQKVSELMKVRERNLHTEETKIKMSESHKSSVFTDEHKENLRKSAKGRKHTEKTKEKMSKQRKGLWWWNNGQINKKAVKCPGDGWNPGFLIHKKKKEN